MILNFNFMKSSSTIIISLLGGVALGCAASKVIHSQRAKSIKESLEGIFQDEFTKFHDKIREKHDALSDLIESTRCRCGNQE